MFHMGQNLSKSRQFLTFLLFYQVVLSKILHFDIIIFLTKKPKGQTFTKICPFLIFNYTLTPRTAVICLYALIRKKVKPHAVTVQVIGYAA